MTMIELERINEQLIGHNCVHSLHVDMESGTLKYNLLFTLSEL